MPLRTMLLTTVMCLSGIFAHGQTSLFAQAGRTYPLVYGPAGRPYGPTQAHYQYLRQYGRPWNGPSGTGGVVQMGGVNGVPDGTSYHAGTFSYFTHAPFEPYAFPGVAVFAPFPFIGVYGSPGVVVGTPGFIGTPGLIGAPGMMGWSPADVPFAPNVPFDPNFPDPLQNLPGGAHFHAPQREAAPIVEPSTPQALQLSLRYQVQGEEQLRQLNFLAASERFRKAIDTAKDQAVPRARLGLTMAARNKFPEAVQQFKLAVVLDPNWVETAESLEQLLGERNTLEKTRIMQRVAEWTLEDVRDPDRLFLLGVMLYLEGDDRSRTMLETAIRVAGAEEHLIAFLAPQIKRQEPEQEPDPADPMGQPGPDVPLPPVPAIDNGPLLPPLPR